MPAMKVFIAIITVMCCRFTSAGVAGMRPANDIQKGWSPPAPATEDEWQKALCKGGHLITGMKGSDAEAGATYSPPRASAQTDFTNFPQTLADYEYYWNPLDFYARQMDNAWGIGNALRDLSVFDKADLDGGRIETESVTHGNPHAEDKEGPISFDEQQYPEPGTGRELPVTMAHFSLGINPMDGMIIVFEKRVARFQAQILGIPMDKLPRLQRSSDIEWGMWKTYHDVYGSRNYNNLRYYLVASVMNDVSKRIIQRVLQSTGRQLNAWPGHDFSMDEDEGNALLGSPVGFPIGYMLMEHKRELGGNMYISKVRLFKSSTSSEQACFLFYIEKPLPSAGSIAHGLNNATQKRGKMGPKL